ncbi:unnamed protein product, partial [Brassica napus]
MSSSHNNSTSSSSTQESKKLLLYILRIYKTQFQSLKEQSTKAVENNKAIQVFSLK